MAVGLDKDDGEELVTCAGDGEPLYNCNGVCFEGIDAGAGVGADTGASVSAGAGVDVDAGVGGGSRLVDSFVCASEEWEIVVTGFGLNN